jgi:hypothetical protein
MMLGLLTRIWRVFWRPDMEGSSTAAVLSFSVPVSATPTQISPLPTAPIAFLRLSGETAAAVRSPVSRHLAARLQSVQRLNPPASRSRPKPTIAPAGKPLALERTPHLKASRAVKPGVVLDRLSTNSRREGAEVVNLGDVRRSRQVEATDRDIAAIFS